MNTISHDHSLSSDAPAPGTIEFSEWTKNYYRDVETYDWVEVADGLKGPEALFHRKRQGEIRRLFARYGDPDALTLDAGCGTGLNLRHLPAGSHGLDINARNLAIITRRLPDRPLTLGDVEAMPYPGAMFGTVLCTEVLEHLPDPAAALAEIVRVLRPGGTLIGMVPARTAVWKLRFLSRTCPHSEPFHNEYKPPEVRAMLEEAGLETIKLGYSLGWFSVVFVARSKGGAG